MEDPFGIDRSESIRSFFASSYMYVRYQLVGTLILNTILGIAIILYGAEAEVYSNMCIYVHIALQTPVS